MPLTDQDIRALTYLAARCRPPHAPRWDEAGIAAGIARVRHLHLADVALSVIRAADDPNAKTPGVIANTSAPNWQERSTSRPQPIEPYDRTACCGTCGQPEHRCRANPHAGHEYETAEHRDARVAREQAERAATPIPDHPTHAPEENNP